MTPAHNTPYFKVVAEAGLEPACPLGQRILNPPRLPFRHSAKSRKSCKSRRTIAELSPRGEEKNTKRQNFDSLRWSSSRFRFIASRIDGFLTKRRIDVPNPPLSAQQALERLIDGNERFAAGRRSIESFVDMIHSEAGAPKQRPIAVILTCADSRVPVELLFDQGIGDLFVIRVAGNIVAPSIVGSVEYAAAQLETKLVVVMGHSRCGAVTATLNVLRRNSDVESDNIRDIVERIRPAVEELVSIQGNLDDEALLRHAIRSNVRVSTSHLRHGSPLLERASQSDELLIVGAEYDIQTGLVEFFDFPPNYNPLGSPAPRGAQES